MITLRKLETLSPGSFLVWIGAATRSFVYAPRALSGRDVSLPLRFQLQSIVIF